MTTTTNGTPDYYNSGNTESSTDTALVIRRLEARRRLTKNSTRLVIVLVGLPARGKSFVARKLLSFLEWQGCLCKIFNVGRYRRKASGGACDANFFSADNKNGAAIREQVAELALRDMLRWIDGEEEEDADGKQNVNSSGRSVTSKGSNATFHEHRDRIAIFDATNSTDKRRRWVLEECTNPAKRPGKPTGVVFVESICDDEELLLENFRFKVSNSPDYKDMDEAEAIRDLKKRVKKYEEQYETITDDSLSYIKIFNLSTKLLVNHIYGRMSKVIVPALMAWNIGTRPIFLCRPGQTLSDIASDQDEYWTGIGASTSFMDLSKQLHLCPQGQRFSEALYDFVREESIEFLQKRASVCDMAETGTSISGVVPAYDPSAPFPLKLYSSTMPRAVETCRWDELDYPVNELSTLNPMDKGDFAGKELFEIQTTNPEWYSRLEKDPFTTRFPGGESYKDLILRLESVVVDVEQQVIPTLVVSHVSVLQMLIAYFRKSPVEEAMQIEVPLHTVLKFTPARGGGWNETHHALAPVYQRSNSFGQPVSIEGLDEFVNQKKFDDFSMSPSPIWGDHVRSPSTKEIMLREQKEMLLRNQKSLQLPETKCA
eukprot:CAMPEP_0116115350 /NCGR_PEP_ID=MMETSP0329-20121206/460_1 /TAXON_ID=697910 /ORGANISM="Pseudo-nitzschia arenysensis, Strain B593" /LENGTH=599 /DNA_ID=CAMNT_0003608777 /DNA_START=140 /DNA_END=1940 /DNA_ORIENTATION=-